MHLRAAVGQVEGGQDHAVIGRPLLDAFRADAHPGFAVIAGIRDGRCGEEVTRLDSRRDRVATHIGRFATDERQANDDDESDEDEDEEGARHACARSASSTSRSQTSRTAPRPPACFVTWRVASFTSGWASATAKARPT